MIVKLLTERHLEFLSLKGGCRGSSESTLVKMSNCWKSHALAHIKLVFCTYVHILRVRAAKSQAHFFVVVWALRSRLCDQT